MNNTAKSILKKYVSLIFALWLSFNYYYLQNLSLKASHHMDSMSSNSFLFYIVLSYSLVSIGYFLWLILYNQCEHITFKIILFALIIILIIGATYWLHSVYGGWNLWKYWGPGWFGFDNAGNDITVETNPGLEYFRWALFCSHIPCIIISVLLYCMEPIITKNVRPIISDIVKIIFLLLIYGLTSNILFAILGIPFFCLPVMLKNEIVHCNKYLKLIISLCVIMFMLITIVLTGPLHESMLLQGGGPVTGYFLIGCLLFFINVWFYMAVLVGLIFTGIIPMTKYKFENPFSYGFKAGLISILLICFMLRCH